MSNTLPEPCTKLRAASRVSYVPSLRHLSLLLTGKEDLIGRIGPTICGLQGAIDQERVSFLIRSWNLLASIKIHELRPCRRCHDFVQQEHS
jgi:hypothetical protein